jgi:DNA-binding transcriptional LysR family regulator
MQLANLDMDILRTLVVAMDHGGFARAAERLGRSQSAVSLQMRRLEDCVGRPLFRKQGRGLALTDAGDIVLVYARRILELNDQALTAARGVAVEGTVRFGVPQDFGETWLPGVLAQFARIYPSVSVEVRVDRSNNLTDRIMNRGLDLALLWGNPPQNAVLIKRLPMVWIGLRGFVARQDNELPLALFESPCVFRKEALEAVEMSGRRWRLALTSPSLAGLWAAASAGLGITVRTTLGLPPHLASLGEASDLPILPETSLSLYTSERSQSPAVARLREILLDELALMGQGQFHGQSAPRI